MQHASESDFAQLMDQRDALLRYAFDLEQQLVQERALNAKLQSAGSASSQPAESVPGLHANLDAQTALLREQTTFISQLKQNVVSEIQELNISSAIEPQRNALRAMSTAGCSSVGDGIRVCAETVHSLITRVSNLTQHPEDANQSRLAVASVTSADVRELELLHRTILVVEDAIHVSAGNAGRKSQQMQQKMQENFEKLPEIFTEETKDFVLAWVSEAPTETAVAKFRRVARKIGRVALLARKFGLSRPSFAAPNNSIDPFTEPERDLLEGLDTWEYNIFKTQSVLEADRTAPEKVDASFYTPVHYGVDVVALIGVAAVYRLGVLRETNVPIAILKRFLTAIGAKYNALPYHNALHGADVAQSTYYFLCSTGGGFARHLTTVEKFTAILAAACHDVGHIGVNNQYIVTTGQDLAITYNDKSCLENMHAATSFRTMREKPSGESMDVLEKLGVEQRKSFRRLFIDMVIATDNALHMKCMSKLQQMLGREGGPDYGKYADKKVFLGALLHTADVSNPAKPWRVYNRWTDRIIEEFFRQGDKERSRNLEVPKMNDRMSPQSRPRMQAGFIVFLVKPLFELMATAPGLSIADCVDQLNANLSRWNKMVEREKEDEAEESKAKEGGGREMPKIPARPALPAIPRPAIPPPPPTAAAGAKQ